MVVSDNFPHEIYIISRVGKTGYVFIVGGIFVLISFNRVPILDGIGTFVLGIILAFINIYIETMIMK